MKLSAVEVAKVFRSSGAGRSTRITRAVDSVSLDVSPGDFIAIVGESGSGKSTLARMLLGLIEPDEGEVTFEGTSLRRMNRSQLLEFRSHVQAIFQDPSASLNPRKTIRQSIIEVVELHNKGINRQEAERLMLEALDSVDLRPSDAFAARFPHQVSGGQRQRVLIARAIVLNPQIIVADEAVSALDVSVKGSVLNLLNQLRQERGIGYVFITHDLPVVRKVAGYVHVMRNGQVVEANDKTILFKSPRTEYTRELIDASPVPDPELARRWVREAAV